MSVKFESNADEIMKKVNSAVYEVLGDFAADAVAKAKANAPKGETGKVEDSISARFARGIAFVGSDYFVARLLETGYTHRSGKHIAAKPFIKPAVLSASQKVKANIKSKLENV